MSVAVALGDFDQALNLELGEVLAIAAHVPVAGPYGANRKDRAYALLASFSLMRLLHMWQQSCIDDPDYQLRHRLKDILTEANIAAVVQRDLFSELTQKREAARARPGATPAPPDRGLASSRR